MGKHTKFGDSDGESPQREKKSHKKEKKQEKRERSRSPHQEREKSPKRDRHGDKSESRRREPRDEREGREHERRRDNPAREERGGNWKRGNERRNDFQRKDDRNRLSAGEIAAQRKALWGNKKLAEPESSETIATSSEGTSGTVKNTKLWSSAIAATGVDSGQANKFMRLMGVKNAPKATDDSAKLSTEKQRQDKMQHDLERQYAVARETTHMGRGMGFGFGH